MHATVLLYYNLQLFCLLPLIYKYNSPSSRVHPNSGFYFPLIFQNKSGSRICEEQIALVPKTDWKNSLDRKGANHNAHAATRKYVFNNKRKISSCTSKQMHFFKNSNTDSFLSNSFFKFMRSINFKNGNQIAKIMKKFTI